MLTPPSPFIPIDAKNALDLTVVAEFRHRWVTELAWSADNLNLAVATTTSIALYRFADEKIKLQNLVGHQDAVRTVQISPDARWLASGSDDGSARLWTIAPDLPKHCLILPIGTPVQQVRYHPNGQQLAVVCGDSLQIWQIGTSPAENALLHKIAAPEKEFTSMAFDPAGAWVAVAGWDQKIRIFDSTDYRPIAVLEGHSQRVNQVAASPDGQRLGSVGRDGQLMLWDTYDWIRQISWVAHDTRPIDSIRFHPSGKVMITGGRDESARLWDTDSLALMVRLNQHRRPILSADLRPDTRFVATGSGDNSVKLWGVLSSPAAE